jgi:hypothetical protein
MNNTVIYNLNDTIYYNLNIKAVSLLIYPTDFCSLLTMPSTNASLNDIVITSDESALLLSSRHAEYKRTRCWDVRY